MLKAHATLLYCWGHEDFIKTTMRTLHEHVQGIDGRELPELFRDAFSISQALHAHWLWIDALCIIQDDPSDWAIESSKMDSVYRRLVFTIMTLTVASPHGSVMLMVYYDIDIGTMPVLITRLETASGTQT